MKNFLNFAKKKENDAITKSSVIHIKTEKQLRNLYRKEIAHWRNARASRYHPEHPSTYGLQDVYMDTMIDGHLTAVINSRILYVQNKKYVVKDDTNKIDRKKTALIAQGWFREIIRYAMESIFYGYSLIWLKTFQGNRVSTVELVDRRHVIPERGIVVQDIYDKEGISFAQYPHHLLYVQFDNSIGLLEKAAPLTILKRHSWANWDEFEQLFGIPIRIVKVPNLEAEGVRQVENWLDQMGTAAYAILPTSADIEIKDGNRSDAHQVFSEKIKIVNAELSKLINGQTMTTDSGSSRSQSEVHERTQQEIRKADMANFLLWTNNVLIPALRFHGYPFSSKDYVDKIESTQPFERIRIDEVLLRSGVRLSKDYLEEMYDVSIDDTSTQPSAPTAVSLSKKKPIGNHFVAQTPHSTSRQPAMYVGGAEKAKEVREQEEKARIEKSHGDALKEASQLALDFKDLGRVTYHGIFLQKDLIASESIEDDYYIRVIRSRVMTRVFTHVYRGIEEKGLGITFANVAFDGPNYQLLKELRTNAGVFLSFKYHAFNREAISLLTDKKGNIRTFNDFSRSLSKLTVRHERSLLKQEYGQAISTAISAKKWHDYQRTQHLYPNLRYVARQDGTTRQSHRALHNMVFPVNHTFWDTHYPPNGWNCRCTVQPTEEAPTLEADRVAQRALPIQEPFNFNPGKEGKITTDSHLYFKLPQPKYQKALNIARHALQHHHKREVFTRLKNKKFKTITHAESGFTVEALSRGKMKSILNQPHDYKYEKDTILYQLPRIFASSSYLGGVRNRMVKNQGNVLAYHYFSFKSKHDPKKQFFFNVRQYKDGKHRLHSITDHLQGLPQKNRKTGR